MDLPLARIRLVAGVALLGLATASCGGEDKGSKDAPKSPASQSSATSGYIKTAAQIVEESQAALRAATSVHVKGTLPGEAKGAKIDVVIAGDSAKGVIDLAAKGAATPAEVVKTQGKLYLKGKQLWVKTAGREAGAALGGKWVIAPSYLAKTFDPYLTTDGLRDILPSPKGVLAKRPPSKINGMPVNVVLDYSYWERPDKGVPYYVAAEGTPYPVRLFDGAKALNFTYEAPGAFTAPKGALKLSGQG
ncbi:LolA-like protein [Actinomadura rudentiformis]|uniref:LppX_LprAFG lipoprotein n=1 Tax=Actinomadura rudentiformis TaxID=359158 RepID=A0A6H9Y7F4_9ACTN|nr:hypothetical protein [Actinomadura rudentiformis]KAB2340570.1 hypothetical protein F8566_44375 [Actinomadura rudentiformis]